MEGSISSAEVLRRTSRTFALSIRLLPSPIRAPVEIAYLLARIADTIADSETIAAPRRTKLLAQLRGSLDGSSGVPALDDVAAAAGGSAVGRAETALVGQTALWLERMRALPPGDSDDVRAVVQRLVETMQREIEWFSGGGSGAPGCLADAAMLHAYTEGIAGCVGQFWTALLARHTGTVPQGRVAALAIAGRRYGRGLQLVNVLRDLSWDLRRGRCFLPADELGAAGITPAELARGSGVERLEPVILRWAGRARSGLLCGLAYSASLPGVGSRVRLATALPAAIGIRTLRRVIDGRGWLQRTAAARISKTELAALLVAGAAISVTPRGPRYLAAPLGSVLPAPGGGRPGQRGRDSGVGYGNVKRKRP